MSEEKIYPYAVSRIRAYENKLFRKQTLLQMADAKNAEEVLRLLVEGGYGDQSQAADIHNFEAILSSELVKAYDLMKQLVPEERFVEIFLYKNDYHNLKVLIKQEVSGIDGEKYLLDGGNIKLEKLKTMVLDRDYRSLPPIMAQAIADAYDSYSKTQNGQSIDIILDKAAFANMLQAARQSDNPFTMGYVERVCDLTNLKSFLRIRKMKKDFNQFLSVYVTGGRLDKQIFQAAFSSENPKLVFQATSYGEICEKGMNSGFTTFEKLCDNYLMDFVKGAKLKPLTLEPLIAFLYAKETEVKTIRIILTSKLNQIDADTIKERLRDAYV